MNKIFPPTSQNDDGTPFSLETLLCQTLDNVCVISCVLHHLSKQSSLLDQLMGRSSLFNSALLHHYDLVVVSNRVQPVGNSDHGCPLELGVNALLDETVRLHVHV